MHTSTSKAFQGPWLKKTHVFMPFSADVQKTDVATKGEREKENL